MFGSIRFSKGFGETVRETVCSMLGPSLRLVLAIHTPSVRISETVRETVKPCSDRRFA
jgi:hypothetical protein